MREASPYSQAQLQSHEPMLKPKIAKEYGCPYHGLNNAQLVTRNIRKPGDVGKFKFGTFAKIRNGLTSWSFEIPASAYCTPCRTL